MSIAPLLLFAAAAVASMVAFDSFSASWPSPGDDPPWYFLRKDVVVGLVQGTCLPFCLGIFGWGMRASSTSVQKAFALSGVIAPIAFALPAALRAGVILAMCDDVFGPNGRSAWATHSDYLASWVRWTAQGGAVCVLLVLVLIAKQRDRAARDPSDPSAQSR